MDIGQNVGIWKGYNYENKISIETTNSKTINRCNEKVKCLEKIKK
jgi:hypothetical protein